MHNKRGLKENEWEAEAGASLAGVNLRDQREVPMALWAGEGQVGRLESLRKKACGAGMKGKLEGGKTGVDKSQQVMKGLEDLD